MSCRKERVSFVSHSESHTSCSTPYVCAYGHFAGSSLWFLDASAVHGYSVPRTPEQSDGLSAVLFPSAQGLANSPQFETNTVGCVTVESDAVGYA